MLSLVLVIVASLGRIEKTNDPRSGQFDEPRSSHRCSSHKPDLRKLFYRRRDVGLLVYLKILVLAACVVLPLALTITKSCLFRWKKRLTSVLFPLFSSLCSDSAPDRHLYPILFFFSLLSFIPVIEPNRLEASLDFVVVIPMIQTRRADSTYCVIAMIAQLVLSVSMYSVPWKIRPVCSAFLWPRVLVRGISFWSRSRNVNHIVWVKNTLATVQKLKPRVRCHRKETSITSY